MGVIGSCFVFILRNNEKRLVVKNDARITKYNRFLDR